MWMTSFRTINLLILRVINPPVKAPDLLRERTLRHARENPLHFVHLRVQIVDARQHLRFGNIGAFGLPYSGML